jgi:hypothetical protein
VLLFAFIVLHARTASPGLSLIRTEDLKAWVSYLASDELEGRGNYSKGLDLAARYIQDHLKAWGLRPAGDSGTFYQTVRVMRVRAHSRSSVTVRVGNETRTFKDGDGVTFPPNAGRSQTLQLERVEFAGYGLHVPALGHDDFEGRRGLGTAVIWLGLDGPQTVNAGVFQRVLTQRARYALDDLGALATIGPASDTHSDREFVAAGRLDGPLSPAVTAGDEFFEFLFKNAPASFEKLKRLAANREPLPTFRINNATLTFRIDVDYEVLSTQQTQNIVAIVDGSDAALKDSYVAFGAHYDHVGHMGPNGSSAAPGRVTPGASDDRIWNGADDDATGTAAVMALARAFAAGPQPRRSMLFVWHAAEELGNYGSTHFTDFAPVPLERIVAQLNIDMIGRNRNDSEAEGNSVYLVGSDRISTELHEISREANQALVPPLRLDYELNDPSDPEQLYYRSDHYSYAVKGIPIIFFTTGLHPDYHTNTDEASRILYDKMTRVVQLVYETGVRLANLEHVPARDRLGPRAGKANP